MLDAKTVNNIVGARFTKQNEQIMENVKNIQKKARRNKIVSICLRSAALAITITGVILANKYKD